MPELPEVETVRRGLAPVMEGARFEQVEQRRPDLRFPLPENFPARLRGARIRRLDRRGKYLVALLSTEECLIMHLGMTGRFTVTDARPGRNRARQADPTNPRHDHIIFEMTAPHRRPRVVFNDPRRFGFMDLVSAAGLEQSKHFSGMGPEPLGSAFTAESFAAALTKSAAPVKAALLDQRVVAGIGNIYACEALYRAGVSPRRLARNIGPARAARLYNAIRDVLSEAIDAGGSTLRDFAASDGALGYFQHRFMVYDREHDACPRCAGAIRRIVQSGRSSFLCPACQR